MDKKYTTKEKVYDFLKSKSGQFISGQDIADELFLTRAAIWKAIKTLKAEGNIIEAVTNRGYCLLESPPPVDANKISAKIAPYFTNLKRPAPKVVVYDTVGSTNDIAKEYSFAHPGEEAVIIATTQTNGRGRRGRAFYSPTGTGMYLSLVLHPDTTLLMATRLTCMMAEAICRAIEDTTDATPYIKWVNDIFVNDKKVSGILTEGSTSMEDGSLQYVIVGLGVNLFPPTYGFPSELKDIAGSILQTPFDSAIRDDLLSAIIGRFYELYEDDSFTSHLEGYKRRSMLIGNYVKIMTYKGNEKQDGNEYALVTGIDDDCHLHVRFDNGREEVLSSGEVSVVKY